MCPVQSVTYLSGRSFEVTAIDIAPSAVTTLSNSLAERNLDADVVLADFLDWAPASPFDAIYEQTSLCALPRDLWENYANQLHRWLKPGAPMYALFMQTGKEGGPPFNCNMDDMRQLFGPKNWIWPGHAPQRFDHPMGPHEMAVILTSK